MPRKKRSSPILDKALLRASGMKSISLTLDLGNGLTVPDYVALIEKTQAQLDTYNTALSIMDQAQSSIAALELALADMSERMLTGVASKYGKSSDQYEMAGGARKGKTIAKRRAKALSAQTAPDSSPAAEPMVTAAEPAPDPVERMREVLERGMQA
jgi:hypothetical protein